MQIWVIKANVNKIPGTFLGFVFSLKGRSDLVSIRKTEAFVRMFDIVLKVLWVRIFNRSLGQLILSTTDTMQVGSTALECFIGDS